MNAKLTLKLNKLVIEKAKQYAQAEGKSLSGIVETYLKFLVNAEGEDDREEIQISPFVESMRTGVQLPADLDYKKDYNNYLGKKYR